MRSLLSGVPLVVENIMEHDAKRRYDNVIDRVWSLDSIEWSRVRWSTSAFYEEFWNDRLFVFALLSRIPGNGDLREEIAAIIQIVIDSAMGWGTLEAFEEDLCEKLQGVWSLRQAGVAMECVVRVMRDIRENMASIQEELGLSFGELVV
jgi:hypothetical protein